MAVRAQLLGAEQAIRRTGKIPAAVKKATRAAVAKIVRKAAKVAAGKARKVSGLLAKSVGSKVKTSGEERTTGIVGPRKGFRVELAEVKGRGKKKKIAGFGKDGKKIALRGESAFVKRGKNKGKAKVADPAKYGPRVEFGHKRGKGKAAAKPYPFVGPAGEEATNEAKTAIPAAIAAAIKGTA